MKDLVIFGTGMMAELADYYFRTDYGVNVVGFTVDAAYKSSDRWLDRPLIAWDEIQSRFPPSRHDLFVAVGYAGLNKVRRAKVDEAEAKGYALTRYISPRAIVPENFESSANQFIFENAIIQPFTKIGRNVVLWPGALVAHHCEVGEDVVISGKAAIAGRVRIGARCFVGLNATIRDNVRIGEDCIIGAGAVILRDLPNGSIAAAGGTRISKAPSHRLRRF